jgi:DNA polymerase-1
MKILLLIDANSIIHRSFHALPPFTGPDGRPTGALYGISAMMLTLLRTAKPDYAAAAFDRPEPTFRDAKYKEYKAQRPATADELVAQIIEARKLFEAFGVKVFEKAGYEADDIIATLAEKFRGAKVSTGDSKTTGDKEDLQVVILTGDRDTLQLVEGDRVVVKMFVKGVSDTMIYDEAAVEAKYGLKPNQMIDYKALVGDASDNIKGVPGIGPKTATEMLQKYGTLEKIFEALPGDEKLQKRLGPFRREAELSKWLVILERHVPIELASGGSDGVDDGGAARDAGADGSVGLAALALRDDKDAIAAYFKTLGSQTLLKRLEGQNVDQKATVATKPQSAQKPLF